MALQKLQLTNNVSDWDENQRYLVNAVVKKDGRTYQNTTGVNSDPADLDDWVLLDAPSGGFTSYVTDFAYTGSQSFTVPLNLIITQVLYNNADITGWSKIGTTLTIVDTLVNDDVIGVRGFTY